MAAMGIPGIPWDVTASRLLMEEVKFEKGDDQKKVDTMVKRVIQMFMEATRWPLDEGQMMSDVTSQMAPDTG